MRAALGISWGCRDAGTANTCGAAARWNGAASFLTFASSDAAETDGPMAPSESTANRGVVIAFDDADDDSSKSAVTKAIASTDASQLFALSERESNWSTWSSSSRLAYQVSLLDSTVTRRPRANSPSAASHGAVTRDDTRASKSAWTGQLAGAV